MLGAGLFVVLEQTVWANFLSIHAAVLGAVVVVLAIFLTSAVQVPLKALSAAGAAVAVLIAAGGASTSWASLGVVSAGIGLVTVLGEIARRTLLAVSR